jgi:Uma2 family endonuclease
MSSAARQATFDDFLRAEADAPAVTRLALIEGEIVEWGANITTRSSRHSTATLRIGPFLNNWLDSHSEIVGVIAGGEARCRLRTDPETITGLDIAVFVGPQSIEAACRGDTFDGPPRVAVEVLSSSDTPDDAVDRFRVFFECGEPQVGLVDPDSRSVAIHRPSGEAALFAAKQMGTAEPELPGFRVAVEALFPKELATK